MLWEGQTGHTSKAGRWFMHNQDGPGWKNNYSHLKAVHWPEKAPKVHACLLSAVPGGLGEPSPCITVQRALLHVIICVREFRMLFDVSKKKKPPSRVLAILS
jgi:hypothetical protein